MMYFVKNKMLVESSGKVVKTVSDEVFLTADLAGNLFDYGKYVEAVRSNLSQHVVRLFLLNENEVPMQDVSEYLLSGNLSYNYQQGQTHSLNLTLYNHDGFWITHPIRGNLWSKTKFRLDIGVYFNGTVYWKKCGIFAVKENNISGQPEDTITLQLYDKFALLDKKISGTIDSELKIPVGTNLVSAIKLCLACDSGGGIAYDYKPVLFETDLSDVTTPYTITKSPNTSIGEVIIDLANMVSCDVFYNENGNLTLRPGIDELPLDKRGVSWFYTEDELLYSTPSIGIDYASMINKIIVKGAIENGKQFKGIAENKIPWSQSNVNFNRTNTEIIEDSNITSDDLAKERAEYELQKRIISYMKTGFKSVFIPHLMPKDVVVWNYKKQGVVNEKYVISSLSFSLGDGYLTDIEMSNVSEVNLRV